jgi:hypothetical protein
VLGGLNVLLTITVVSKYEEDIWAKDVLSAKYYSCGQIRKSEMVWACMGDRRGAYRVFSEENLGKKTI